MEGKIASHWVSELECETIGWLESGRQVVLDFSGVRSIGPQGAAMLKSLSTESVAIVNCPALIKGLLCGVDQE